MFSLLNKIQRPSMCIISLGCLWWTDCNTSTNFPTLILSIHFAVWLGSCFPSLVSEFGLRLVWANRMWQYARREPKTQESLHTIVLPRSSTLSVGKVQTNLLEDERTTCGWQLICHTQWYTDSKRVSPDKMSTVANLTNTTHYRCMKKPS